jgi:putative addiction module component (TIGR02574 family)
MVPTGDEIMDYAATLSAVRALNHDEKVRLVSEVWDEVADDFLPDELDEDTKRLLDERIADMERNPDDVVPWEQVYAEAKARLRQ